jgi:BirA family biotin operon repressor/biotin-[acetyl-CoA-carboxylase] ligase
MGGITIATPCGNPSEPPFFRTSGLLRNMNLTVLRFDTLESTNTEAANQAKLCANEGLCILARQQTAGRGRQGRTWVSEPDSGLYLSVVLRPKLEIRFLGLITLMAGIAVHDLLKEFGLRPDIKWVNDILVGEKKICGILAENVETPIGMAVIVGIGINLRSTSFSPEIMETATSVEAESGTQVEPDEIVSGLTGYLSYFYEILLEDEIGPREIVQAWRVRSSYFSGKRVRVSLEGQSFEGVTDGLESTGALRVRTDSGHVEIVQAGDVQRLRSIESE